MEAYICRSISRIHYLSIYSGRDISLPDFVFRPLKMTVLYIHGMGGGSDSRIPSILSECLGSYGIDVIVRTYDFDPDLASMQLAGQMAVYSPDLIIGESLGSLHALRLCGCPHLFVSPALNAPFYFEILAWLSLVPGVTWLFDRIYKPREGDRQQLHFTYDVLRKYRNHRKVALEISKERKQKESYFAFFGTHDHYRRSGIVSLKTWKKHFGATYRLYEGTHFMEECFVREMLANEVLRMLNITK